MQTTKTSHTTEKRYVFYVVGDPQVGNETQEERMDGKLRRIRDDVSDGSTASTNICLVPGDLTENGVGPVDDWFVRTFCMCAPYRKWAKGETLPDTDQLRAFRRDYWTPLQETFGHDKTYACIGNHDTLVTYWTGYQPVTEFVARAHASAAKNKNKSVYASTVDNDGLVYVVALGKYPSRDIVKWFERVTSSSDGQKPSPLIVPFFHYNLFGPFGDWWSDADKDRFHRALVAIKDRVPFIAVGHHHSSYVGEWRGFRVVNGSGAETVRVSVTIVDDDSSVVTPKSVECELLLDK